MAQHSRQGNSQPPAGMPRWVKGFLALAVILLVVVVVLHLNGTMTAGHGG